MIAQDPRTPGRIRAVICDLGGVVIRIDPDRIQHHWARRSALPRAEVHAAFPDEAYLAFERDELTEAEYLEHVRTHLELDGTDDELADDFCRIFLGVDPGTVQVLHDLRAYGWQVIGLSNTNRIHQRVWSRRYAAELAVFDAIHCSYELKARKPEAAAFTTVLDLHDLHPAETLFVDDLAVNVEAARDVGLHGSVFTTARELRRQLAHLAGGSRGG